MLFVSAFARLYRVVSSNSSFYIRDPLARRYFVVNDRNKYGSIFFFDMFGEIETIKVVESIRDFSW